MKNYKLKWSGEAKDDLKGIKGYIAQFAPRTAESYIRRIREHCRKLATMPYAAPMVEEYQEEQLRETYFGNYRIIYEIFDDHVVILNVIHGARLLPSEPPEGTEN